MKHDDKENCHLMRFDQARECFVHVEHNYFELDFLFGFGP